VWGRPDTDLDGLAGPGRIVDLLLFDSFLLECVFRSEGHVVSPVTLDIGVHWLAPSQGPGWRRVTTTAVASDHLALTTGTLHGESGVLGATATSSGRLFRPTAAATT
jgi:hypothetical protein